MKTRVFIYLSPENVVTSSVTLAGWFVNDLDQTLAGSRREVWPSIPVEDVDHAAGDAVPVAVRARRLRA
jgi:hypothetical protein